MLRVNNKTISFAKGENIAFSVEIKDADNQPFIFPVIPNDGVVYSKFLEFSVTNEYGEKVIDKIMDLSGPISYIDCIDYSEDGYAKFSTQIPVNVENVNTYFGYVQSVNGNSNTGTDEQQQARLTVAKHEDNYYCWCSNNEDAQSDDGYPAVYKFNFILNLLPQDTINLRTREYRYDLTAYIKSPQETVWKRQLIAPAPLILEDSNNDY